MPDATIQIVMPALGDAAAGAALDGVTPTARRGGYVGTREDFVLSKEVFVMPEIRSNPLRPGSHRLGPDDGSLQVLTYREGMAQKVGHDLIIDVGTWEATLEVDEEGAPASIVLEVDSRSLRVREGLHGVKPLTDKDRAGIHRDIEQKILRGQPISFRSISVNRSEDTLAVDGMLTIAGAERPVSFSLTMAPDGSVTGRLPVTQSEWGIKPYRAFMGALKVRDAIEVMLEVRLPAG